MPLYEADFSGLTKVSSTTFEAEGWKERNDIQRILRNNIAILEEGLLVLTDEFSAWTDSTRRIDLLCIDKKANLVVVELKRSEDGGHMDLQAIRYAAMVSTMTFDHAARTLAGFRGRVSPDIDAARAIILEHVGWSAPDEAKFADDVRIILASADFGRELTTAVFWLRQHKIDVRCVRLRPHRPATGKLLVEVQQLIPLPEAADYLTRLEEKTAAERKPRGDREAMIERFLSQLAELANSQNDLHRDRTPNIDVGVLTGSIGRGGFSMNYVVAKEKSRAELLIAREDGHDCLRRLREDQTNIEDEFGGPFQWGAKAEVRQCRIYHQVDGGYGSSETEWPVIQQQLVTVMEKIDLIFRRRVQNLD